MNVQSNTEFRKKKKKLVSFSSIYEKYKYV